MDDGAACQGNVTIASAVMMSCGMRRRRGTARTLLPKMPAAMPPGTAQACGGPTPSTSSIFQRFWVRGEHDDEGAPAALPTTRANQVHQVGTGADGDQASQGRYGQNPGRSAHQRAAGAADHGHQRVGGDQAGRSCRASGRS